MARNESCCRIKILYPFLFSRIFLLVYEFLILYNSYSLSLGMEIFKFQLFLPVSDTFTTFSRNSRYLTALQGRGKVKVSQPLFLYGQGRPLVGGQRVGSRVGARVYHEEKEKRRSCGTIVAQLTPSSEGFW